MHRHTLRNTIQSRKQLRIGIQAILSVRFQAHSVFQRSSYSFGGAQAQASQYWQQVPSWDDVKDAASKANTVPEPSLWQHTKSFVTRKPVRQVQVCPLSYD